jgi:hypothetical protein
MLLKRFRSWLRATLRRRVMEREMEEELRFHLESYAEDLMCGGMERSEARLEFGSVGKTTEACRQARGVDLLDSLLSDIYYGLRLLRRTPGFAGLAIVTPALGIGATTAVLDVVHV